MTLKESWKALSFVFLGLSGRVEGGWQMNDRLITSRQAQIPPSDWPPWSSSVDIIYDLHSSDCDQPGEVKIQAVRTDQVCSYLGPCPSSSGLGSYYRLGSVSTANMPEIGQCLNETTIQQIGSPFFIHRSDFCGTQMDCSTSPQQIRLGVSKPESTTIVVEWATWGRVTPKVIIATSEADLRSGQYTIQSGTTEQYSVCGSDCGDPYNTPYESPYLHTVTFTGLNPDTTYYYRVGDPADPMGSIALSNIRSFKTLPAPNGDNYPLHLGIVGDIGQTTHSEATCVEMAEDTTVELKIILGDLSYADGDGPRWDGWGRMAETCLSSGAPFVAVAGNHEIEYELDTHETFKAYRARYHGPENQPEIFSPMSVPSDSVHAYRSYPYEFGSSFYSIKLGPAYIISLNTYAPSQAGSSQYNWLVNELKNIDRTTSPWVVAIMHGPFYNSNVKHQNENATVEMKNHIEHLLTEYSVNLVFAGHVHAYERFHQVYQSKCNPGSPHYITIGDGGNREKLYNDWPHLSEISAFQNGLFYGWGRLSFESDTQAKWEWQPNAEEGPWDEVTFQNQLTQEGYDCPTQENVESSNGSSNNDTGKIVAAVVTSLVLFIGIAAAGGYYYFRRSKLRSQTSLARMQLNDEAYNNSGNKINGSISEELDHSGYPLDALELNLEGEDAAL